MIKKMTDKEIEKMLAGFDFDKEAARQEAERDAFMNDPANAEMIAKVQERMAIAEALYKARKAARLTQKELAEKMQVKQPLIAQLERGRGNISIDTIHRFAAACGKKVSITLL
jgi:ribosome-binding protein aMBF1 (putative translation factor)